MRNSVRSVVVLEGAAAAVAPQTLRAPGDGELTSIEAKPGDRVLAGMTVAIVRGSNGVEWQVTVPDDGAVLSIAETLGARVHAGDDLLTFAPQRFQAVAVVEPALLYRLYGTPVAVRVQLDHGPSPFDCPFVSLGAEVEPGANPFDAPVIFRCSIPREDKVFAGIRLRIAVVTAEANDVLTIPVEAVVGSAERGVVTYVEPDGRHSQREVVLGITDGIWVEVVTGLKEGDQVVDPPDALPFGPLPSEGSAQSSPSS